MCENTRIYSEDMLTGKVSRCPEAPVAKVSYSKPILKL